MNAQPESLPNTTGSETVLDRPSHADRLAHRSDVLRQHGATSADIEALLYYNRLTFSHISSDTSFQFPLTDEPFVEAWENYLEEAQTIGVFPALRKRLVQLQFPIQDGSSQDVAYRNATRGLRETDVAARADRHPGSGLQLDKPEALELSLHQTPAGRLPVITAGSRPDFVALVRALLKKNEPAPVPASMGAVMAAGYVNWDRVHVLRTNWARTTEDGGTSTAWIKQFQSQMKEKEAYQDTFILMSQAPYSAISASDLNLNTAQWRQLSAVIRREHECTHYVTRRVFGSMRATAHDELIADYAGITAALGRFRADWFLRFMGLEAFPSYREGGRLQNYRGDPSLTDDAFSVVQSLVVSAAKNLQRYDETYAPRGIDAVTRTRRVAALTQLTLEELAGPDAHSRLHRADAVVQSAVPS